jgi:hypothetical protein
MRQRLLAAPHTHRGCGAEFGVSLQKPAGGQRIGHRAFRRYLHRNQLDRPAHRPKHHGYRQQPGSFDGAGFLDGHELAMIEAMAVRRIRERRIGPMKPPRRLQSLIEEGLVDTVVRQLMSGKEAMVYVVRCGDDTRCAKVYKEATHRSFRQAVDYTENRKVKGPVPTRRAAHRGGVERPLREPRRAGGRGQRDARDRRCAGRRSGAAFAAAAGAVKCCATASRTPAPPAPRTHRRTWWRCDRTPG